MVSPAGLETETNEDAQVKAQFAAPMLSMNAAASWADKGSLFLKQHMI